MTEEQLQELVNDYESLWSDESLSNLEELKNFLIALSKTSKNIQNNDDFIQTRQEG